jgi:hypothetical protein
MRASASRLWQFASEFELAVGASITSMDWSGVAASELVSTAGGRFDGVLEAAEIFSAMLASVELLGHQNLAVFVGAAVT